ncbi:MAG: phage tail tip lysozyme [Aquabacterium sp.]
MNYTSREQYGGPAPSATARAADPGQAGLPARQLAQSMAEVSAQFTQLWGQAEQAKTINEATSTFATLAKQGVDMQLGFAKDPDPSTVPQRFETAVAEWKQRSLEGLKPGVAQHVERQLAHYIPTLYRQVIVDANQRNITNLRSGAAGTMGEAAQGIAGARDDPQLLTHVQSLKQTIAGNVRAGVFTEAEARGLFSKSIAQAISIRAAGGDPNAAGAAQGLLERFKDEMDAGDVAHLTTGLRGPLERQQGETAATASIALSGTTTQRAQAVEAAFIARGWSPAAARGLAANAVRESGANPSPALGDGGRSSGLFQWNDSRRAAFVAQYGTDPHNATLDQQVAFADTELRTTEGRAGTALAAAKTPEEAAKIASTQFLRPRDTATEETRRAGIATRLGGGTTAQRDTAMADVRERLADAPLHVRLSAESQVAAHYSHLEAQNQQARALLATDIKDLSASYGAGNTTAEIPEARIRALAPTAEAAQRTIDELTLTRTAGDAIRATAYAGPADEAAMRARLAGDPADTRLAGERQQAVATFDHATASKARAATADPAGYAATAPEVQALREARAPLPQIIAANLAVQSRIGLPPSRQRILDNTQVEQIASTLRTTGPEKADMAATLAGVAQEFGVNDPDPAKAQAGGALWNRAYGELVKHGKIGWEWQAVAAMTHPAQAEGRALLQRALVFEAEKGGPEALRKLVAPDVMKGFPAEVDTALADFREATRHHPGGDSLFDTTRRAVDTLATYHAWRGAKAADATKRAYEDVIGARWDTAGDDGSGIFSNTPTMLVPKGQGGKIETALERTRLGLKPTDLAPLPSAETMSDGERSTATHGAAQRGFWINNADASGAVLKGRTPGGSIVNITRADGSPIEIRFDALPTLTPSAADRTDLEEGRAAARALRERSR